MPAPSVCDEMSLERVDELFRSLPPQLYEQVSGYARAVKESAADIFRGAGVEFRPALVDDLVFIGGVKKFFAICRSNFWVLDSSMTLLARQDVHTIKIGASSYSRGSPSYRQLAELYRDLELQLREAGIYEYMLMPLTGVVRELVDGR